MRASILNRDFVHPTDGWYHIEPKGEHLNREAGVVQVIDDEALRSMVNRFQEEASKPNFAGMLVDHEHFKHQSDKETTAYGWLMNVQGREDGLYGEIRWTRTGKEAVDGGDYRFFSTEYESKDAKILNTAKPRKVRPLRLSGLTLTNDPGNKGGKPITNRDESGRERVLDGNSDRTNEETKGKTMRSVNQLLGLSADADEASVHAEVTKIMNRAKSAEDANKPLTEEVVRLKATNGELLAAQVESDLTIYGNRFKAEDKEKVKAQLISNRAGTIELLKLMPTSVGATAPGGAGGTQTPMHNRRTAGTPATTATEGDDAAEQKRVRELEAEIDTYKIANRCSYDTARNVIRSRKPELFGITN